MHAGKQDPAAGRDGHWPSVLPQRGNLPCCAEHCSAAHWRAMREKPSAISSLLSQVCPLPHPTAASRDPAAATFPRWGKDMCRVAPGARPDLRIPTDTSAALRLHRRGGGPGSPCFPLRGKWPKADRGPARRYRGQASRKVRRIRSWYDFAGPFCCDKTGLCREGRAPPLRRAGNMRIPQSPSGKGAIAADRRFVNCPYAGTPALPGFRHCFQLTKKAVCAIVSV